MSSSDAIIFGEVIAHLRIFTDIPFAKEIALLANTEPTFKEFEAKRDDISVLAARYEVRFKSVSAITRKFGNDQILEIASGLSGRGLEFSSEQNNIYIETDLPEVLTGKRRIVEQILKEHDLSRTNLFLNFANALHYEELSRNADLLSKPLTVVCEGLLSNLSFSGMRDVVSNIQRLLSERGGIFITPDFFNSQQRRQSLANESNTHTFENDDEIFNFISDSGFKFERFLQSELVSAISCKLNFDREELQRQIENRYVYKLEPK